MPVCTMFQQSIPAAYDDVPQAARRGLRHGLHDLAAAIRVDARPVHRQLHQRHRGADVEAIGHAVGAGEREDPRVDLERQGLDVERLGFVAELVRGRQEGAIPQIAAVEAVVAGQRIRTFTPSVAWPFPLVRLRSVKNDPKLMLARSAVPSIELNR